MLYAFGNWIQPALSPTDAAGNTAAVQLAFDVARAGGQPLTIEPGIWPIDDTITLTDVQHFTFVCVNVRFNWRGANDRPMFFLEDVRQSIFSGFRISCDPTYPLSVGIRCNNGAGGTYSPAQNRFERIIMSGTNNAALDKGFLFDVGAGGDNNNDYHHFEGCWIYHFATAAYSFEASQSKAHQFMGCGFSGYGAGQYGVATKLGTGSHGGSFWWRGGGGGGCTEADFGLGTPNDTIMIDGFDGEDSARLLHCGGPTSAPFPVQIANVRWAHAGSLAGDGYAISFNCAGPLSVRNCRFEGPDAPLAIRLNAPYEHSAISVEDSVLTSSLTEPILYSSAARVWLKNNTRHDSGGNYALPNIHHSGGETVVM